MMLMRALKASWCIWFLGTTALGLILPCLLILWGLLHLLYSSIVYQRRDAEMFSSSRWLWLIIRMSVLGFRAFE